MGSVEKLRAADENARMAAQIDELVAKFRKECVDMRQNEEERRAQKIIKHRRAAVWINKPEALLHMKNDK
jgi:hypothetical protein